MAEQRSSKSHARVRFLLSLIVRRKKINLFKTSRFAYFCCFRKQAPSRFRFFFKLNKLALLVFFLFSHFGGVAADTNGFLLVNFKAKFKFFLTKISHHLNFYLEKNTGGFFFSCFFFLLNFNQNIKNFKFLKQSTLPNFEFNSTVKFFEQFRQSSLARYPWKVFKQTPSFNFLTFPKILKVATKYHFISKFLISSFSLWFRSYFSNFALRFKKWNKLRLHQGFQSTAGYTNFNNLFYKILYTRRVRKFFIKSLSYLNRRLGGFSVNKKPTSPFNFSPDNFASPAVPSALNFCTPSVVLNLFYNPTLFKYFFFNCKTNVIFFTDPIFLAKIMRKSLPFFLSYFRPTNIYALDCFSFFFKKYFLYVSALKKYEFKHLIPFQISILRFMRFCSGKNIFFKIFPFLSTSLTLKENTRCSIWAQKVKYYRKVLGPKLLLNESLQILYLCLKNKDIHLFSEWVTSMFYKISFWKHKTFLRYIKYVLRHFFLGIYGELEFKGMKYQLKGKISVAGNSRTRTSYHYVGFTSHSTFNNKILHRLNLVRTFTGVLGLKIWFVF